MTDATNCKTHGPLTRQDMGQEAKLVAKERVEWSHHIHRDDDPLLEAIQAPQLHQNLQPRSPSNPRSATIAAASLHLGQLQSPLHPGQSLPFLCLGLADY